MSIAENIRTFRKFIGMSQKELAEKSGLSLGSIQGYEQGRYIPKHDNLIKIANALRMLPKDLDPARYNESLIFDTPEEFEKAWIEAGGGRHPGRSADIARIELNEEKLNDTGIKKLADHSDLLLKDKANVK